MKYKIQIHFTNQGTLEWVTESEDIQQDILHFISSPTPITLDLLSNRHISYNTNHVTGLIAEVYTPSTDPYERLYPQVENQPYIDGSTLQYNE